MLSPMSLTVVLILIRFWHMSVFCAETVNETVKNNSTSNETEITKKIDKISNTLLSSSSARNITYILDSLENKLLNASQNLIPSEKKRVKLIIEGVKLKLLNLVKANKEITEENVDVIKNNDYSKISTEITSKVELPLEKQLNVNNLSGSKEIEHTDLINDRQIEILANELYSNGNRRVFIRKSDASSNHDSNNVSKIDKDLVKLDQINIRINTYKTSDKEKAPPICDYFINRTCEDIKNINRLKCKYEQSYITVDKLCDGTVDCPFESDEKNCYSQVWEQFLYVKNLENYIESSQNLKCFQLDASGSILTNQAKILRDMLNKELNFKIKYQHLNNYLRRRNTKGGNEDQMNGEPQAKSQANNIALVISSLALALDGALCSNNLYNIDTRRSNNLLDLDPYEEFKESIRPSTGCKCKKDICVNCTHYCNRLCRQEYSLTKWNCESLDGFNTISLNLLCDGKTDCFDESDELGCDKGQRFAKFEASETYSNILTMLKLKASKQRPQIQNKLLLLSNSIKKLQSLTTKSMPKLKIIKELRDKCYSMLRNVYSEIVKLSDVGKESEEAYLFLLSINQNLGSALKLSHTGNTKLSENACGCRNGTCSLSYCSKICAKACSVKPKLSKYYCYGKFNKTVSIDKICDGIHDCRNGYDELNCKTDEICRRHHLVLLRHDLQKVGENLKGTALGELLSTWKLKVITTLKVLENSKRPTPRAIKNVARNILDDLAITYGSVEIYRRSTENYILEVFLGISQIILESIKSCRK